MNFGKMNGGDDSGHWEREGLSREGECLDDGGDRWGDRRR